MTVGRDRFILGIYNYCDYWCERCAFTGRCRNFVMGRELEREARGEKPVEDATNAAFWNGLADKLRETTVFGRAGDFADGCDDGFDDGPDPEWDAREAARGEAVRPHALSRLAWAYMKQTDAWLKGADRDLNRAILASGVECWVTAVVEVVVPA